MLNLSLELTLSKITVPPPVIVNVSVILFIVSQIILFDNFLFVLCKVTVVDGAKANLITFL